MVLKISITRPSRQSIIFLVLTFFTGFKSITAQKQTDTTKVLLLASLEKKAEPGYYLKKTNIVYPEILTGNEDESIDYIEKFSSSRRDYLIRMHTKGKVLLPKAATILKKYDLPEELKILLTLESAYNGNAVSKAGAVGYWQIMDEVAKEYGMKYTAHVSAAEKRKQLKLKTKKTTKKSKPLVKIKDDRKNFNASTHTAARYLKDRRRNLDDNWLLVVASYNCGVGNVWEAMKKSDKANPGFWDIKNYLPAETRAYVMNFIALNVIFNNYDLFVKNKLNFKTVKEPLPEDLESYSHLEASSDY